MLWLELPAGGADRSTESKAVRSRAERLVDAARRASARRRRPRMLDRLGALLDGCRARDVACPPERRLSMVAGACRRQPRRRDPNARAVVDPGESASGAMATAALLVGCGPLGLRTAGRSSGCSTSPSSCEPVASVAAHARHRRRRPARIRAAPRCSARSRMGRGNRLFEILKFRTMRCDEADRRRALGQQRRRSRDPRRPRSCAAPASTSCRS